VVLFVILFGATFLLATCQPAPFQIIGPASTATAP
jgi:hypothetical protein